MPNWPFTTKKAIWLKVLVIPIKICSKAGTRKQIYSLFGSATSVFWLEEEYFLSMLPFMNFCPAVFSEYTPSFTRCTWQPTIYRNTWFLQVSLSPLLSHLLRAIPNRLNPATLQTWENLATPVRSGLRSFTSSRSVATNTLFFFSHHLVPARNVPINECSPEKSWPVSWWQQYSSLKPIPGATMPHLTKFLR